MLDIKFVRNNPEEVKKILANHTKEGVKSGLLEKFQEIDEQWRKNATLLQKYNTERNSLSAQIATLVKNKETSKISEIKNKVVKLKEQIEKVQALCNKYEAELKEIMFSIPNILDKTVPIGDESKNKVIRKSLTPKKFSFKVLTHGELAIKNKLIDFERGAKISGSRGYILTGNGSKLMRALRDFTLDLHSKDGYIEVTPPTLIKEELLYGLGKIPFFVEDMYKTYDNLFLTATEEFPITAMFANEVLDVNSLPLKYTGSNTNWRREAGSAGKDVGGILRVHYFWNTELINFTTPDQSFKCLEAMTKQAEKVLKLLRIPYRVVLLASGDTGAAATKTYDIEVWIPSEGKYREISSCSNCLDYQSRGLNIKYKNPKTQAVELVHTLNGTGTSLNRLWIALVENFQQKNGSINIPSALQKYFHSKSIK